ncbi:MAG TPA: tetratricopeptide repeat protein, partial [Myxococcota bacterium]|nr:tetratricopeptide repeat protein [Myxococcota bacterium]
MRAFYYMSVKGVRVAVLSGLLAFTACGSSGGQVRGDSGASSGGGGGSAQSSESGGDDDFTRREVTEVKAPVYLEGIAPEAQDAFREAVAMVSRARPDLKGAEKKFKEASEKAPDFLEAYFNWGQTLERQGKGDEALKVYQRALDQNPGDPTATAYIAKVYLGQSRAARFLGKTKE